MYFVVIPTLSSTRKEIQLNLKLFLTESKEILSFIFFNDGIKSNLLNLFSLENRINKSHEANN